VALKGYNVYEWVSGRDRDGNCQVFSSRHLKIHDIYVNAVPLRRDGRISHCFLWRGNCNGHHQEFFPGREQQKIMESPFACDIMPYSEPMFRRYVPLSSGLKSKPSKKPALLAICFMLGLLFDPEDGSEATCYSGIMFL
jgi:hypothetical protein